MFYTSKKTCLLDFDTSRKLSRLSSRSEATFSFCRTKFRVIWFHNWIGPEQDWRNNLDNLSTSNYFVMFYTFQKSVLSHFCRLGGFSFLSSKIIVKFTSCKTRLGMIRSKQSAALGTSFDFHHVALWLFKSIRERMRNKSNTKESLESFDESENLLFRKVNL